MLVEGTCTTGGGFLRHACGAEPVGQCVYCGAPFCAQHGELGEDYHEVCARMACQAKYRDVREHREWVRQHRFANATSVCAGDACHERMQHACQRCQLRFCTEHLRMAPVVDRRYRPPRRVTLMLCLHCGARRRLWD